VVSLAVMKAEMMSSLFPLRCKLSFISKHPIVGSGVNVVVAVFVFNSFSIHHVHCAVPWKYSTIESVMAVPELVIVVDSAFQRHLRVVLSRLVYVEISRNLHSIAWEGSF